MYTTIKISVGLKRRLEAMKVLDSETYEELLSSLVEDHRAINEKTQKDIASSREDYRKGRVVSVEELRKKAGLGV